MITSENNQTIRRVRALMRSTRRRYRENTMVVEGTRVCEELMRSSCRTSVVLYSTAFSASDDAQAMLTHWSETVPVMEVSDDIFALMSDTEAPQGILALAEIPQLPGPDVAKLIVIPDQIRDPGNLGTILRTAWAAGVTEVILPVGTVDYTNPKVVRAGMGAHFYVPTRSMDWPDTMAQHRGTDVWVADARGTVAYTDVDWCRDSIIVIGGEAAGASESACDWAKPVAIPMAPGVDSLNAAVAGAVIMFEAFRQRKLKSDLK